jgi:hypothetical protein
MAHTNSKSPLETLRQQQLAIVQKIKDAEAKARKKEREDDQRRPVLVGRIILNYLDGREALDDLDRGLLALIERDLSRPADRKLFASLFAKLDDANAAGVKPKVAPAAPNAPPPPPALSTATQTPAPQMPHIDLASLLGRKEG